MSKTSFRKRILFYADRPQQVFNATCLAAQLRESGCRSDLLVANCFPDAPTMSALLDGGDFFENIALCEQIIDYSGSLKSRAAELEVYLGFRRMMLPGWVEYGNYNAFCIACPCPETFNIIRVLRHQSLLECILYEEGTGSYNGNVYRRFSYLGPVPSGVNSPSGIQRCCSLLMRLALGVRDFYAVDSLYIKHPDFLEYEPCFDVRRLCCSDEVISLFASCGPLVPRNLLLDGRRIVVLDEYRVSAEATGSALAVDSLMKRLTDEGIAFGVRRHPASKEPPSHDIEASDCSGGLWELACHREDFSQSMLVGICSSAQLAPFLEGGQKPAVMFLYRMCADNAPDTLSLFDGICRQLYDAYGGDSQIYVPSTEDEAIAMIKHFMSETCS